MPKSQSKGFQAVIDRLTPTDTTGTPEEITKPGTLQRSRKGLNEVTGGDYVGNLQSLPGTPEEIINKTGGDELRNPEEITLLSDRTDNDSERVSDGGYSIIKNMVRDSVDRIVVSINSSKRILDRIYKYKGYKPEEKK